MTKDDRIAALRETLRLITRQSCHCGVEAHHALSADDLAASAPLPDLPLAEGSEWATSDDGKLSVHDELGNELVIDVDDGGAWSVCCYQRHDYTDVSTPNLLDVLALARRGGHV